MSEKWEKLSLAKMQEALQSLDRRLPRAIDLIIGGGGAMLLAHQFPLATSDIDAVPRGMSIHELDVFVKQVSMELGLPGDWLNPYFSTFAHTLPSDYKNRLIEVFKGLNITALALGLEDLLVMKCFAHRQKDVGHSKRLLQLGADVEFVRKHIESLDDRGIPGCDQALDFLDDLMDQV